MKYSYSTILVLFISISVFSKITLAENRYCEGEITTIYLSGNQSDIISIEILFAEYHYPVTSFFDTSVYVADENEIALETAKYSQYEALNVSFLGNDTCSVIINNFRIAE